MLPTDVLWRTERRGPRWRRPVCATSAERARHARAREVAAEKGSSSSCRWRRRRDTRRRPEGNSERAALETRPREEENAIAEFTTGALCGVCMCVRARAISSSLPFHHENLTRTTVIVYACALHPIPLLVGRVVATHTLLAGFFRGSFGQNALAQETYIRHMPFHRHPFTAAARIPCSARPRTESCETTACLHPGIAPKASHSLSHSLPLFLSHTHTYKSFGRRRQRRKYRFHSFRDCEWNYKPISLFIIIYIQYTFIQYPLVTLILYNRIFAN